MKSLPITLLLFITFAQPLYARTEPVINRGAVQQDLRNDEAAVQNRVDDPNLKQDVQQDIDRRDNDLMEDDIIDQDW